MVCTESPLPWRFRPASGMSERFQCPDNMMTGIKEVSNGTVEGSTVSLNTRDHDTAKATFCNELVNYRDFSHNDLVVNEFGKQVER